MVSGPFCRGRLPSKFDNMVRSLHDGMMAIVIENGDVSDPFQSPMV